MIGQHVLATLSEVPERERKEEGDVFLASLGLSDKEAKHLRAAKDGGDVWTDKVGKGKIIHS